MFWVGSIADMGPFLFHVPIVHKATRILRDELYKRHLLRDVKCFHHFGEKRTAIGVEKGRTWVDI